MRTLKVIIYLFFPILFVACTQRSTTDASKFKSSRDSCAKYATLLNVDTLRNFATKYLRSTEAYSRDYYHALHFCLLADFNAKKYNEVLERIKQIYQQPNFNNYPDIVCRYLFTEARAYQRSQQYTKGIEIFKKCLKMDSSNDSLRENIRVVVVEAMLQMVNSYHSEGKYNECAMCLDSLNANPSKLIAQYCMRDLYSMRAYSVYMTDQSIKSITLISKALAMPMYKPTDQRLFRDYSYAAAIYYYNERNQRYTIYYCKKALGIGAKNKDIAGLGWLMDLLSKIYQDTGKIQQAINLYQWGIMYARSKNDIDAEAYAYINLVDIYMYIELYDQANVLSEKAIATTFNAHKPNPMLCIESFLRKGKAMFKLNKVDSAFYYLHKADNYSHILPYSSGEALVDKLLGTILVSQSNEKNIQEGIFRLKRALTVPLDATQKADIFLQLARGLIKQHNEQLGEAMIDSMYTIMNANNPPIYLDGAYHFALQYFLGKHNNKQIERFSKAYLKDIELKRNRQTLKKVTQFILHYSTERQEQQLKLTESELYNRGLQFQLTLWILIVLVITSGSIACISLYKRRNYILRHKLMEVRLDDLSNELLNTTKHSQEVEGKLTEVLDSITNRSELEAVTPNLFKENNEAKFRYLFTKLYPRFLERLKSRVPKISRNDEILCMLIALDQNAEQMVDILCIAKSSLNMNRHRLRQKMNLQRDESLEDTIKSMIAQ